MSILPFRLHPLSLAAGLVSGVLLIVLLRWGGLVPRVANATGLAGGVAVAALADLTLGGARHTDAGVRGRVATAVTALGAVAAPRVFPFLSPVLGAVLAFAVGIAAGNVAVGIRKARR
ncbi:MAG: hypothetical protein U0Y82_08060 [Thermoleophilia bacterium]